MKKSLYDISLQNGTDIKNTGFDYEHVLLKKVSSSYLYKNRILGNIMFFVNKILVTYVDSVKKIRIFSNFTVDKNYKNIN